jgi:hypothetical protein
VLLEGLVKAAEQTEGGARSIAKQLEIVAEPEAGDHDISEAYNMLKSSVRLHPWLLPTGSGSRRSRRSAKIAPPLGT